MTVATKRTRRRAIRGQVRGAVRHRAHDDAYHGARGEELALNITGTSTANVYLQAWISPGHVCILADDLASTWVMTNNNANELTQMANSAQGSTITFQYDAWGRTTKKTLGAKNATYAYRYGSKLHAVTSDHFDEGNVTYEYGGDQKRRSRDDGTNETWYNWDRGWNTISEEDGGGTLTQTYVHNPRRGGRATYAQIAGSNPASGTASYFRHDYLGSTRALYDASKNLLQDFRYTPYGEMSSTSSPGTTHLFTGHQWDRASGLYFAPFRHYNSAASRWTSRDPLGMVDGPHLYSYARNNSIANADPMGGWVILPAAILILVWIGACGLGSLIAASEGPQGNQTQHCTFGCALKKCMGPAAGGDLAWAINDIYEWWQGRGAQWEEDNEAARFGSDTCGCDPGDCTECCSHHFPPDPTG